MSNYTSFSEPESNPLPYELSLENIEHIAPGAIMGCLEDGRIVYVYVGVLDRDGVDRLIAHSLTVVRNWSSDRPILTLFDVRTAEDLMTPYNRARIREMLIQRPDVPSYSAIVIANSIAGVTIAAFSRAIATLYPNQQTRIFTRLSFGLAWLKGKIARVRVPSTE